MQPYAPKMVRRPMFQPNPNARRDQALEFLYSRIDYERMLSMPDPDRAFRLERMRELLQRLGNPQDRLKIVHVAGTKGKGSTSAMIAAILTAAGHRTGLYTSPHLDRLEERIMVDGEPCSGDELAALVDRVKPIVEQMDAQGRRLTSPEFGPTYFEVTTAMAFSHFAAARTDAAVIEVGMGGRLDSTNVCRPMVSVITSISFDHTGQLGSTLGAIAREKAGIIKAGVPVVSGVTHGEPRQVIEEVASQCGSRLLQLGTDFEYMYHAPRNLDAPGSPPALGRFDFDGRMAGPGAPGLCGVELGLLGRHQAANAAVALAVVEELRAQGWQIPERALRHGLASVQWPARVEIVARRPTVVVDAAHNTASVQSLLETLEESFGSQRRLLVFATTQDKDVRGMLRLLLPRFEAVILTRYLNNPRAVSVEELDTMVGELSQIPRWTCPDPASAWEHARGCITPEHLVCVTGSFYLAAEMRAEVARQPATTTPILIPTGR